MHTFILFYTLFTAYMMCSVGAPSSGLQRNPRVFFGRPSIPICREHLAGISTNVAQTSTLTREWTWLQFACLKVEGQVHYDLKKHNLGQCSKIQVIIKIENLTQMSNRINDEVLTFSYSKGQRSTSVWGQNALQKKKVLPIIQHCSSGRVTWLVWKWNMFISKCTNLNTAEYGM